MIHCVMNYSVNLWGCVTDCLGLDSKKEGNGRFPPPGLIVLNKKWLKLLLVLQLVYFLRQQRNLFTQVVNVTFGGDIHPI